MIIKAEHPYAKYFTLHLDGEIQRPFVQYDTIQKIAALGKAETARLRVWEIGRAHLSHLLIGESYEIRPSMFVRDVQADFQLRFSAQCPPHIREQILR